MAEFSDAVALDGVPPGRSTVVEMDRRRVALFNVDGTVHAISDNCMHAGQSLGYGIFESEVVRCRGHDCRFDVTTGFVVCMPGAGVPCDLVRVQNGRVQVSLT